jgi:uncharacterized membrane protein YbhN (UPF0104 family)
MSRSRRSLGWRIGKAVISTALIGGVLLYLWLHREVFLELRGVEPQSIALVASLTLLTHFLNAQEFGLHHRTIGVRLGIFENWMLFTAGQLGNHLPARLGTIYRFRYLKLVHRVPYGSITASYGANLVISTLATGLTGLAGVVLLGGEVSAGFAIIIFMLGCMTISAIASAWIRLPRFRSDGWVGKAWLSFCSGWEELQKDRPAAAAVLLLEFIRYATTAWRLQITFSWMGVEEPLAFFLIISSLSALVTVIGFTPAGLGLRELAIGSMVTAMGRSFDTGLVASSADRAISLIVVTCSGLVGLAVTAHRMKKTKNTDGRIVSAHEDS